MVKWAPVLQNLRKQETNDTDNANALTNWLDALCNSPSQFEDPTPPREVKHSRPPLKATSGNLLANAPSRCSTLPRRGRKKGLYRLNNCVGASFALYVCGIVLTSAASYRSHIHQAKTCLHCLPHLLVPPHDTDNTILLHTRPHFKPTHHLANSDHDRLSPHRATVLLPASNSHISARCQVQRKKIESSDRL